MLIAISKFCRDNQFMKYDVVGLGNALLDYHVEVPFDFLKELNVVKGSMTLVETAFQTKAITQVQERFHQNAKTTSGGCAANTLAGLAAYGGRAFFFGKVGRDEQGHRYREDLRRIGVDTILAQDGSDLTGTCLALVTPDAERTMLTHLGIATSLQETDISPEPIQEAKIVYIEGYLWDSPSARKASLKALDIARSAGKKTAFTYSDSFCVDRHHSDFLALAKEKVDILFCNESEAMKATKTTNPREAFRVMKDWCDIVCVSIGPEGALLSDRKNNNQEDLRTWDVPLVDKLGAGDLFAAGVLFGLTSGKTLREAGYLGSYAATRVIQQMGARLSKPLAPDISTACVGPLAIAS